MFSKDQINELKQANKKLIISGVAVSFLIVKIAQQEIIDLADEVVDYLKDKKTTKK